MEQRPLRLGDIVDDYCTRERRITNHAVVALVGDAIRQTRCTTCDTEHPYKGAREPRLRKKPATSELYDQVLAGVNGNRPSASPAPPVEEPEPMSASAAPGSEPDHAEAEEVDEAPPADGSSHEVWPGHRRLIRATLPRSDSEPPPPRPIPEFTMHQRPQPRSARGFRFRGQPNGHANGNVAGGSGGFGQGRPSRPGRHRHKKRPR
ncbi:MAG: hypothetical protein IT184_04550 [Acidobacteria bacterium]|nr:hypothetical protein [Acidobacteriota bacterium]